MQTLPEQTLASIGRMTVAATDLEHLLAWIGADRAGGDARAVFAKPGEALLAARGAVEFANPEVRDDLIRAVEAAGTQLAVAQAALRRLWAADPPAGALPFDDVAGRLLRCREWLAKLVSEHLVR